MPKLNEWNKLIIEGEFTLKYKVDESELITIKGENKQSESVISLYPDELAIMLGNVKLILNTGGGIYKCKK